VEQVAARESREARENGVSFDWQAIPLRGRFRPRKAFGATRRRGKE